MACFSGAEGLGVLAGLEDEKYPLADLLEDMANLVAGDRFCGNEPRWGGRLAYACQKAYRRFTSEGFLVDGMPVNYGSGGAEIVRTLAHQRNSSPRKTSTSTFTAARRRPPGHRVEKPATPNRHGHG